jgi:hypothetical protein
MMSTKSPLFGGGLRADPEERRAGGAQAAANPLGEPDRRAQKSGELLNDSALEVDLLDDAAVPPRGRNLSILASLAALAVFGGIAWYAYDWGVSQFNTTRLPIILADSEPIKSRPESPGGLEVPNQNVAVLNDLAPDPQKPQVERLLPPLETPQPPPSETVEAEIPNFASAPLETAAGPPDVTQDSALPPLPPEPQTEPQIAAAPPKPKVEAPKIEVAPAPAIQTPSVQAPAQAPTPAPQVAAPQVAAPQVAVLPPASAPAGAFVVQLASLKAKDGARPAWARMQKAHPALLGERVLAIQEIDLGARGLFYRVQAGYFTERAEALSLCNALKARGQDCLVIKR